MMILHILLPANLDYIDPPIDITIPPAFEAGDRACTEIDIIDDPLMELDEIFGVTIIPPDGVQIFGGGNGSFVTIIDNDIEDTEGKLDWCYKYS